MELYEVTGQVDSLVIPVYQDIVDKIEQMELQVFPEYQDILVFQVFQELMVQAVSPDIQDIVELVQVDSLGTRDIADQLVLFLGVLQFLRDLALVLL